MHGAHASPSIAHSMVEPSVAVRKRSAVVSLVGLPGMLSTNTSGGAKVETVKANELAGPMLPAASTCRVWNV